MPLTTEERLRIQIDALRKTNSELQERCKFLSKERKKRPGSLPVANLKKFQANFEFQDTPELINAIPFDRLQEVVEGAASSRLDGYVVCGSGVKPSDINMKVAFETVGVVETGDIYGRPHRHTVLVFSWDHQDRYPNPRLALLRNDDRNFKDLMKEFILEASKGVDEEADLIMSLETNGLRQNYSYVRLDRVAEYADKNAELESVVVIEEDNTSTLEIVDSDSELSDHEKQTRKRKREAPVTRKSKRARK